jgi:beta-lactamase class A
MRSETKKQIISIALAFAAGAALVWVISKTDIPEGIANLGSDVRQTNTKYKFIRPLLSTEGDQEDLKWFPAERKMKAAVEEEVAKHSDVHVGLHFVNLTNSGWFGVNGSENFIPASLLKLPLYASYLKLRESSPGLFDEVIHFEGKNFDQQQNLGTGHIQPGNDYSVKELLEAMIVESDNNALELLYQYKQDSLKEIFTDLQIPLPEKREDIAMNDYLSPRGMSRFLMVLYNASYLTRDSSEEALQTLSKTNFYDGIVAGVSKDVKVSHKFGEREMTGKDGFKELHDCGIVYHPRTPYILCVMTKGQDFKKQEEAIQKVSEVVYNHVSSFAVSMKK